MSLTYFPSQNTYINKINDQLFFLTLKGNRYFQAKLDCSVCFQSNCIVVVDNENEKEFAQKLVGMGLLTQDVLCANKSPFYLGPIIDCDFQKVEKSFASEFTCNPLFIFKMLKAFRFSSACISKLPIIEISKKIMETRKLSQTKSLNWHDLAKIINTWKFLRFFYWKEKSCLFDSLALIHILTLKGYYVNLVFGIRDEPFEAHAWLQLDGVIVNDDFQKIKEFSPIYKI